MKNRIMGYFEIWNASSIISKIKFDLQVRMTEFKKF